MKRVASETLRGFDGGAIVSTCEAVIYMTSGFGRVGIIGVDVEYSSGLDGTEED